MSKALINAAPLKPEVRLAQAVSEFEASLSSEQKTEFRANRDRAANEPLSIQDVLQLMAEINRRLPNKGVGARGLGTRTHGFLQCVQQFAALGDIVVGGAQNLIASGVWSLVRTSLLLIVKFSSFFEKLSTLLMNVGRSAPHHEKIGLLYPHSKNLRKFLFEYFIVVVRLCHQMLKFTQKSALGRFGTVLSDSELSDYQSQLKDCAEAIEKEMIYLMAHSIEAQRWPAKFSKKASHQRQMSAYSQALKFCSEFDHTIPCRQARKAGGTSLFHRSPEYMDWRNSGSSQSLILTGKLGSGKTVLLANMVDDLTIHVQDKKIPVAFFFCRHDLPDTLKPRTILGSLVGQLLRPTSELADSVENNNLNPSGDQFGTMRKLFQLCFFAYSKAYLVIDGLDECDAADRKVVIEELRQLQEIHAICVCATVRQRPQSPFVDDAEWTQLAQTVITALPNNHQDIEAFIQTELESRTSNGKLVLGNPALVLEIRHALVNGSQGMFLWVALQIETLCSMPTDEAIRQALADLPRDLSETFARILRRCAHLSSDKSHQKTIFELILVARRPLTAEEMREALSVIPGDPVWNPSRLVNNIFGILACCGSLLTLDEEEMTVRLVHKSVRKFLIQSKNSNHLELTKNSARKTMRDIILTYLNYGVFETKLSTNVTPKVHVDSAPTTIVQSTLEFSGGIRDAALKSLKSRKKPGFDIGKTLAEYGVLHPPDRPRDFHFLPYARSNCLFHVLQFPRTEKQQTALLIRLLDGTILESMSYYDWHQFFFRVVEAGSKEIVNFVLRSGRIDPEASNSNDCTALHQAVFHHRESIVALLIDSLHPDPNAWDSNGCTALHQAIFHHQERIVNLLLDSPRTDPNAVSKSGQTPLHVAAKTARSESIAKLLLESPSIDPHQFDSNKVTPLLLAVQKGNTGVAKALIMSGEVNVNIGTRINTDILNSLTPLHEAARQGNTTIASLLLDSGNIKCTYRDDNGMTALHLAALHGVVKVVNRILECDKARLNDKDAMGRTPLYLARKQRQYAAVEALIRWKRLSPGVWEDLRNFPSPILEILPGEHFRIRDVSLNARDQDKRTLLQRSIAGGTKPETLRLLMEMFHVDPECRDSNKQTALHTAAIFDTGLDLSNDGGCLDMYGTRVETLLDSEKFDNVLDTQDTNGLTPLGLAELHANGQGTWALQTSDAVKRARGRLYL